MGWDTPIRDDGDDGDDGGRLGMLNLDSLARHP
jgi:hypothetical protein